MVRRKFYINGKPSSDFGIYAASDTYLNAPAVGYDSFSVPKVNGLFISEKDRLSNVTRRFSCFAPDGIKAACEALFQYLYSIDGYFVLQSDYDVEHYCYAYFEEGVEVTPFRAEAGTFDLYFSCMPQKYIGNGQVTGYFGGQGHNLLNADQLASRDAYWYVGDENDLWLTFCNRGSSVYSYSGSARIVVPQGEDEFILTADIWNNFNPRVTVITAEGTGGATYTNQSSDPTKLYIEIDCNGSTPISLSISGYAPNYQALANIMLQKKTATPYPYEPYETLPPAEKWFYQSTVSDIDILPTHKFSGLQDEINENVDLFPSRDFWFDWSGVYTGNAWLDVYTTKESIFCANKIQNGVLGTYDTTSVKLIANSQAVIIFNVSEPFEGIGYVNGTATYEIEMADVSNPNAVGGDALYRVTAQVGNGTQDVSIMVNDALIFVDLTGVITGSSEFASIEVNSKTYDCVIYENGNKISGNSRTTIYGDISLKSQNKMIASGRVTYLVNAGAEVEWWTV